jgi:membrane protein YqaA with SNARE-associated domain
MEELATAIGVFGATLAWSLLAGLVPLFNSELYLVGAVVLTDGWPTAVALALVMTVGQTTAKILLYKAAAKGSELTNPRLAAKLARARELVTRWNGKPKLLLFVSAVTGLPPFYLVSLLAGAVRLDFRAFVVLSFIGRAIRFVTIALVASLA